MRNLFFLILLTITALSATAHEQSSAMPNSVNVSGNGEIQAEPDQATLKVSVTAMEENLATAKKVADERYKSVLKVIKNAGIPDKQVKLINLSMQPQHDWETGKQRYRGERVTRNLNITINDLDKVADLMQDLVENKVSTVDGVSTGFQNRRELVKQALGLATDDAKEKAIFLAKQLDRSLGKALVITDQSNAPVMRHQNIEMRGKSMMSGASAAPAEMFGTQTITANIYIRFKLD